MPAVTVQQQMPVSSAEFYERRHGYSCRLEWDTLLREAQI